jgi:cell division transport system ATP-binding protein
MIHLQALTQGYPERKKVLDQISIELRKGDFLYVLGGTGAGKSTLLRLIATEDRPTSGKISLFGYDLAEANSATLQAIRRSIGYVPQTIRLIPDFTVFENVALGVSLAGSRVLRAEVRSKIYELLDRLQLISLRDSPAARLSGGEAQRVAIARAIARAPSSSFATNPQAPRISRTPGTSWTCSIGRTSAERLFCWRLMIARSCGNSENAARSFPMAGS